MPDFTMCLNEFCPAKRTCYRYMAIPKEFHQSVQVFNEIGQDICEDHREIPPYALTITAIKE